MTDRMPPPMPSQRYRHAAPLRTDPATASTGAPHRSEQPRLSYSPPPPARSTEPAKVDPWPLPGSKHRHGHQNADTAVGSPKPGRAKAYGYALAGFLFGIAFWHAVGFWGLVHDAVFSGPRQTASHRYEAPPAPAAAPGPAQAAGTFDERSLRNYSQRPASGAADIATGSIETPAPSAANRQSPSSAQEPLPEPASVPLDETSAPAAAAPVATENAVQSWQPAVTTSR